MKIEERPEFLPCPEVTKRQFFGKLSHFGSNTVLDWVYDNRVDELTIGL